MHRNAPRRHDIAALPVTARSYEQLCPVALSMDVVGDRWTMLVLRDLLWNGGLHFGEILDANPGLSPSLLSQRLRTLGELGLTERLDTDPARGVYRLTDAGEAVRPVIDALYSFGSGLLEAANLTEEKLRYLVKAGLRAHRPKILSVREPEIVRLVIDGLTTTITTGGGAMVLHDSDADPTACLKVSQTTFVELLTGMRSIDDVGEDGISGDRTHAAGLIDRLRPQ